MFQYALVADNGEVQHVMSMGADDDYVDGQIYNGLTAVQVAYDVDAENLIATQYYVDGSWLTREPRANQWQEWVDGDWVFNARIFADTLRFMRNSKLLETDWTQIADNQLSGAKKAEWVTYRQALRDVPANNSSVNDLNDIIWPNKPE